MKFYHCTLFLMFPTLGIIACKSNDSGSKVKIVGGETVESAADKRVSNSTVLLYLEGNSGEGFSTCTGTLIGPRHVVTASHCLKDMKKVYVHYGPKYDGNAYVEASGFLAHPKHTSYGQYDIGVVSLASNLPDSMMPVALAQPGEIQNGTELLLAGYGKTAESEKNENFLLHQVRVKVAATDDATRTFNIEAYTKRGACGGDSGGPAYIDRGGALILVGATIGGSISAACDEGHGMWTIVPRYQGWMACAFASLGNPLSGLNDDESKVDCQANGTAATPSATGNCNYDNAAANKGWGFDPTTGNGDNCRPRCNYDNAAAYNGWGYDPTTGSGEFCPPR